MRGHSLCAQRPALWINDVGWTSASAQANGCVAHEHEAALGATLQETQRPTLRNLGLIGCLSATREAPNERSYDLLSGEQVIALSTKATPDHQVLNHDIWEDLYLMRRKSAGTSWSLEGYRLVTGCCT